MQALILINKIHFFDLAMKNSITINFEQFEDWKELSADDQVLVESAQEACALAYAPYSKFHVGAAVKLENGKVLTGSNQENVAYPSGMCAERVVLFYAGAKYPKEKIETLCIVAKGDLLPVDKVLSPCGGCRQVMLETENRQKDAYRVILINQDGTGTIFNSALDLLPLAFGHDY